MASARAEPVELAFAEEADSPMRLHSSRFPSKLGGKPAWLRLDNLPSVELHLKCGICKQPCIFLAQIYAPMAGNERAFHRSLFVFVCRNALCCRNNSSQNFVVLRSQLPRLNQFYSSEPPPEADELDQLPQLTMPNLCAVCGCLASTVCQRCDQSFYCSHAHQELHSKTHANECGSKAASADVRTSFGAADIARDAEQLLFPEYELVIETEQLGQSASASIQRLERRVSELVRQAELQSAEKENVGVDSSTWSELESISGVLDKHFEAFSGRVKHNPEQVLRYQRGGQPLLASSGELPPPADCQHCGQPRVFECQLMPHTLALLGLDELGQSIDWATLLLYSCAASCDSDCYLPEVLLKQDFD